MRNLILLITISLSGCLTQKKLAEKCAEKFPIKEEIKEVIIIDTIQSAGDTIVVHFKDSSLPVICPPSKTITKIKEVKIKAENTAKTYLINEEHKKEIIKLNDKCIKDKSEMQKIIDAQTKEIDKLRERIEIVNKYKHRFYLLLLGIILYFAFKYRRFFSILF